MSLFGVCWIGSSLIAHLDVLEVCAGTLGNIIRTEGERVWFSFGWLYDVNHALRGDTLRGVSKRRKIVR